MGLKPGFSGCSRREFLISEIGTLLLEGPRCVILSLTFLNRTLFQDTAMKGRHLKIYYEQFHGRSDFIKSPLTLEIIQLHEESSLQRQTVFWSVPRLLPKTHPRSGSTPSVQTSPWIPKDWTPVSIQVSISKAKMALKRCLTFMLVFYTGQTSP